MGYRARINGIDLHYRVTGDGPSIVFVHGGLGNHLSWWQQVPTFAEEYQCVTFDQRMFGLSRDVPDGPGAGAWVDDLEGLLDHLGIDSVTVVGQSFGGRTAAGFASEHPDRTTSLVLTSSTGGLLGPEPLHEGVDPDDRIAFNEAHVSAEMAFLFDALTDLTRPKIEPPEGVLRTVRQFHREVDPSAERIDAAEIPVLILGGERDELTSVDVLRRVRDLFDEAEFHVFDEAAHSSYFEVPDEFNRVVMSFLQDRVYR